jgi:hypothetical protein
MLSLSSAAPGQEAAQTIPVRISVANKSGVNADNLQIQAWVVVGQSRYQLDLGGESPAGFRDKLAQLTARGASADQYPAPPNVNLSLMLRNVGSEPFSFTEPGPQTQLNIVLEGSGAIGYSQPPPDNGQFDSGLAPLLFGAKNTFIRPNETVAVPIRSLRCLPGGAPSYWTQPGDYSLRIAFNTAFDDMYGRIKWRGVVIESDPIRLTVEGAANPPAPPFGLPFGPALPPAAAGLGGVDPRNWTATAGQLQQQLRDVNALYNEANPRARDARLAAIQQDLDRFVGTQVEWTFPLSFVTAGAPALLQPFQPPPPQQLAVVPTVAEQGIYVQMATEPAIPGALDERFNPMLGFRGTRPMLVEGRDIPNNVFATLKQGDPITVRARIERIRVFQFFNPPPSMVVLLSNVTLNLGGQAEPLPGPGPAATFDDRVESFDAVELNRQLIGNELRAAEFKGKTIEVTGQYYGVKIVPPANGAPEAYLLTFQNYAGLSEAMHIKCLFLNKADLVQLRPGDPIKVRGKVVSVVRDIIVIQANLIN